jgi:SUN domain-containing protein 1/2
VISIRCTQQYSINTRVFHIAGLIPYSSDINDPRTVIQGNELQPGMCWAFQDFPGYLLIKLRTQIYVTGFTIEHASKLNLPNGEMKSAPKIFNVWVRIFIFFKAPLYVFIFIS